MNFSNTGSLASALTIASNVNASPDSKMTVQLAMRNRHGDFVLAGVFGQAVPPYVKSGVARFYKEAHRGDYKKQAGCGIPRRYGLGDILALINEDASKTEDEWALTRLQQALPLSHDAVVKLKIEQFYREYVAPHVVDVDTWTQAETAMIVILMYSFENPMHRIYDWFAGRLGSGITSSLQRYQLELYAAQHDRAHTRLVFDPMFVMALLRVIAKPDGIQTIH